MDISAPGENARVARISMMSRGDAGGQENQSGAAEFVLTDIDEGAAAFATLFEVHAAVIHL